jgi:hypothetical protein
MPSLIQDFAFYLSARARWDVRCEFVATCWAPAVLHPYAEAVFVHQIPTGPRAESERVIQVTDMDGHGGFSASGEPRIFEEPDYYRRSPASERLPRDLLARYAAAVGVAVDNPGWWDGPVTVVTEQDRKPHTPADPGQEGAV